MMNLSSAQKDIVRFCLRHPRGNVWAGMGLGKTLSMLTALSALELMTDTLPALVVAPKRVATGVWPLEVVKWASMRHLKVSVIVGTETERYTALLRTKADIYVINYDNLQWLADQLKGGKWFFRTVIADESTRLKGFRMNSGGARATALSRFAPRATKRWYNLTGTPTGNGLKDLWGQQWFVDFGKRLGATYTDYMQRWFTQDQYTREITPHPWAEEDIKTALADCTIAIRPEDHHDLPPLVVNNVYIELPHRVRLQYEKLKKDFYVELESGGVVSAGMAMTKSMKLLQIANGCVFLVDEMGQPTGESEEVHDEKLEALKEIISEANGEPVLVAYHFTPDRDRILKRVPGARFLDDSPKTQQEWNEGKIPVLVAHPKSAGHGLNLQDGGRTLVMFGHWWSFEEYAQIVERIGPMRQLQSGHPRTVYVHNIMARGTIDELVVDRRSTHAELLRSLMDELRRRDS